MQTANICLTLIIPSSLIILSTMLSENNAIANKYDAKIRLKFIKKRLLVNKSFPLINYKNK